jgi:alpha-acetolactate decarboxylase
MSTGSWPRATFSRRQARSMPTSRSARHLHFLGEDRSIGGHVLDLAAHSGDLRVAAFARFDLHLPTDDLFLRTELTHAEDHRIVAVEGGVAVSAEEPS